MSVLQQKHSWARNSEWHQEQLAQGAGGCCVRYPTGLQREDTAALEEQRGFVTVLSNLQQGETIFSWNAPFLTHRSNKKYLQQKRKLVKYACTASAIRSPILCSFKLPLFYKIRVSKIVMRLTLSFSLYLFILTVRHIFKMTRFKVLCPNQTLLIVEIKLPS